MAAEQIGAVIDRVAPANPATQLPAIKQPKHIGRPTTYTEEIATTICDQLKAGKTLRAICRQDGYPGLGMVFRWLKAHESFKQQYAEAREIQAWNIFDEILEISDDSSRDMIVDNEGIPRPNNAAVGRDRLKSDNRKWFLAKALPKVFGDHSTVDIDARIETVDMTEFELARRFSFLLDKQGRAKIIDGEK